MVLAVPGNYRYALASVEETTKSPRQGQKVVKIKTCSKFNICKKSFFTYKNWTVSYRRAGKRMVVGYTKLIMINDNNSNK